MKTDAISPAIIPLIILGLFIVASIFWFVFDILELTFLLFALGAFIGVFYIGKESKKDNTN